MTNTEIINKIISFEPRYKRSDLYKLEKETLEDILEKVKRKLEKMSENTCVCCGEIIPEGRQYCINCGNVTKCELINDLLVVKPKATKYKLWNRNLVSLKKLHKKYCGKGK